MSRAIKTAISLPWEEFRMIESLRRETHQSRSKILLEAIHTWLKVRKVEELERRYVKGYQKHPERVSDVEGFYRAGLVSFDERESW
jgi:hypothetical protein